VRARIAGIVTDRRSGLAALFVAAGLAASACKSTEPRLPACTEPVVLSVSSAASPRFSWSPQCLMFRVEVQDTAGAAMWAVQANAVDSIAPGVTYGVMPQGAATQPVAPVPLQSGRRYALGVFRYAGPPADSAELLSAILFRQP
jgi:hypothetical protein